LKVSAQMRGTIFDPADDSFPQVPQLAAPLSAEETVKPAVGARTYNLLRIRDLLYKLGLCIARR